MLLPFFTLSLLTLIVGIFFSLKHKSNEQRMLSSYQWLMIFLFVAATWYFVPYYLDFFQEEYPGEKLINTVFLSAHHALRLFVVGAEYSEIYEYAFGRGSLGIAYCLYGSALYLASPAMTFGFILSFFQNLRVRMRLQSSRNHHVYLFSELNEASVGLSTQINEREPSAIILFSTLNNQEDENMASLEKTAKGIGAITFRRDLVSIADSLSSKGSKITCVILGEREELNIQQAALLLQMKHTFSLDIYVQSQKDNHLFEDIPLPEKTALFRINHVRTSVLQTLERSGEQLLHNAVVDADGNRIVGALVLGLGAYGSEMIKALSWFTQVDGYATKIYGVDQDVLAADRFKHACPGFFTSGFNRKYCDIQLYTNLVCGTWTFDEEISKLKDISYIFIALGDDDLNICTAYEMRTLFARIGSHPVIHALVRNSDKKQLLEGRKNHRGQYYDITYIGSSDEFYTLESIFSLEKKDAILEENSKWFTEEEAVRELTKSTRYEWSESYIMHRRLLRMLGKDDRDFREVSEHRRWVNMMFSYGYLSTDSRSRNDLARLHYRLCDYEELT